MARGVLEGAVMNALFFGTKRAFHGMLAFAKPLAARYGLTPARFDLMHGLRNGMSQRELRAILGVSRTTLSRMLQSLEKLGYIVRTRWDRDRRQKLVWTTSEGRDRFGDAYRDLVRYRAVQRAIEQMHRSGNRGARRRAALVWMCGYEDGVRAVRRAFGDTAKLEYRWRPHHDPRFSSRASRHAGVSARRPLAPGLRRRS